MNRTTAFGMWRFAESYLQAAEVVEDFSKSDLHIVAPRYYLIGHAIELSLKAFLLAKGVSLQELRSMKLIGHDLERALVRAEALGFLEISPLSDEERNLIILLNKTYHSKEHEYITTGYVVLPETKKLLSILKMVLSSIKILCLDATTRKFSGV